MKSVFFYGLFMDPEFLKSQHFHPCNAQLAYLQNHQLIIGEKASLIEKPDARAYGTVIQLSSSELQQLYNNKGVQDYEPQIVEVHTLDETAIEATCYILPTKMVSGSNSDYARKLMAVVRKLGLPDSYAEEIGQWII